MSTFRATATLFAALLIGAPAAARAQEAPMNPHTREACLHCHRDGLPGAGERTRIFPSHQEPHAVLQGACRSCHKEGREDFWLLILPRRAGERQPQAPEAPAALAPIGRPALPLAAAPAPETQEGFENSHDSADCAGCHDKPAGEIKKGDPPPPRFAEQGVNSFCRSCHSGIDTSHFPRGNVPRQGVTCLNCHRVHGRSLMSPSLRDDFPQFLADSAGLNPHGGRIYCLACHPDTPQPGQPVNFRHAGDSLQMCRRCHAGVEHHPLGVASTPETWKMDFSRFPLEGEAVTCVTCHKPPECLGADTTGNPRFLRGGPYNTAAEFCDRCHEGKSFSSLNPHDQMDPSGQVYEKKCLYCHAAVPAAGATTAEMRFTDALTALCVSCHQVGAHPGVDHLLPMPARMLATLAEYEEQRMVRLPLEDDRKVTCSTCHNPHERGLLKGAAGVGADELKRLRLTTYNEQCTPCHGRH